MTYPLFDHALDQIQREAHAPMNRIFAGHPITAVEARDEAIARVARHTPEEWRSEFRRCLEVVARRHLRFNADPVWELFQKEYMYWEDAHPRAAGAVILKAMKDGVIVKAVNMFWNSNRRSCHGRPIQTYMSLIFNKEDGDGNASMW